MREHEAKEKLCPVRNAPCEASECMWWIGDGIVSENTGKKIIVKRGNMNYPEDEKIDVHLGHCGMIKDE